MDDQRWRQVDDLLGAALELPTREREAYLDQECAGDTELRQEVEELLSLEEEAQHFLAEPMAAKTPNDLPADEETAPTIVLSYGQQRLPAPLAGRRIGPYRMLRPLGHGGMGTVYLARREDDFQQNVAIKVVRPGAVTEETERRFHIERQALAAFDHPNIARLLDGGTTEDGLPYLVMEWIDGVPVDDYCDTRQLSVRERLEIFRQICAAVDHAHRNLLVHCDIKPSNVLVTPSGIPKLLDFGIVKLLSDDRSDWSLTQTGMRPMTPGYASPEQILGEAITTAADIYALGCLLYKLLCGRLPRERFSGPLGAHPFADLPEKPSRRLVKADSDPKTPNSSAAELSAQRGLPVNELQRQLRGDIDAIVMKAIRLEAAQRYGSVDELSRDVGRYLAAEPVQARDGNWRYLVSRFLRRTFWHPNPRQRRERLLWMTAFVALILGSWAFRVLQRPCGDSALRLQGIWDSEVRTAGRAAFLATGLPFAEETWRQVASVLDERAEAWTTMRTDACEATYIRREQSEQTLDQAMACLEGWRAELRAMGTKLAAADTALVINALDAVGQMGDLAVCNDPTELAILAPPPSDPGVRQSLDNVRATVEEQLVRYYVQQPVDFEALKNAVTNAENIGYKPLLARSLFALGLAESHEGGAPDAGEVHLEEALRAAIEGGDRLLQPRVYAALVRNLARQQGNTERASFWIDYAHASLAALGAGHDQAEYEVFSAEGILHWTANDVEAARGAFIQAVAAAERDASPYHLITALNNLGMLRGQREYLHRAIEVIEKEYGPNHVQAAPPLANLAMSLAFGGRYAEALTRARRSLELQQGAYGDSHPDTGYPLALVGQILLALGRPDEASSYLEHSLSLVEPKLGQQAMLLVELYKALAEARYQAGRYDEALDFIWQADAAQRGPEKSDRASGKAHHSLYEVLGNVQREAGDLQAALATHEKLSRRFGRLHSEHALSRAQLAVGETFRAVGRTDEAQEVLEEALALAEPRADRWMTARLRWALAQTIQTSDPQRARRLATAARQDLEGEESGFRWLIPEMDRVLLD